MLQYQLHAYQAGAWTDPVTKGRKSPHTFRSDWRDTLDLLERETRLLGMKGFVVIELDVHDGDIRADRQGLTARGKQPVNPGVIVSFETKQGPMRFACDAYSGSWRANVRAVALTLEALRAIDRWGAAQTGQQYTGWLALPPADDTTFPTADAAARWLRRRMQEAQAGARRPLDVASMSLSDLYRDAVKELHPDRVGKNPDWDRLQNARLLLQTAQMI